MGDFQHDRFASPVETAALVAERPGTPTGATAARVNPSGPDASVRALARANFYAIAVVLLIVMTVGGVALWSSYQGSLREAATRSEGAAALIAEQLDLSLLGIDNALQGLGERMALGTLSGKVLNSYLARRSSETAMVRFLAVVGADGRVIADSRPASDHGLLTSFSGFGFFRSHLEQADGSSALTLSPPIRGLTSDGWVVPVSRAVRGVDGSLRAVVVAAVDPDAFDRLFRAINGDSRLWGAVTKQDGALLAPLPFNPRLLETPLADYPWFVARLHDNPNGIARLRTPDGVDRMVVHRALSRWPLIVAVGLAADDALAPFYAEAQLWALGLTLALGLIVFGARYHLHQAEHIAHQASRLRSYTDELTRANAELHYRNLLLDAQFQMSPDGILVVDADGAIRSWNHRFGEIWQLSEDQMTGGDRDLAMELACEQLLDPGAFLSRVDQLFRNLADEDHGGELLFRDGRIVERFSSPLSDHLGRFSGRIWFFRDVTPSRRAAETARKLAAIVNSSNDAIIGMTIDGIIESWNAAAELMFGFTAEQCLGQPLALLIPVEQDGGMTKRLAAAARGEPFAHLETVGRNSAGTGIHLSVTISPIRDDSGAVTGLSTIARDITRRKMFESALREREQRNRVVLESLSEGVLLYDANGIIIAANTAAQHILGGFLGDQDLIAGNNAKLFDGIAISADGTPLALEQLPAEQARATGEPVLDVEIGLIRPGEPLERTVWLLVNAQAIDSETGELKGVVVSLLDITIRKRALEELRESESHFRRTFDESPIGAAVVSLDNRFLRVNAELCRITGYEATALLGLSIPDITWPEDRELDSGQARQLIAGEISNYQVDKRCYRRDGAPIWLHFSVRMIRDSAGQPNSFLPMIEDITERKLAEERLARSEAEATAAKTSADLANRAKSEFLATMSHELRSPLNAILGFAEILCLEMFGPLGSQRYLGYAKDIHDSGSLLLSVIGDILDLSKIEAGKLELHEEAVEVDHAIAAAVRLVQTRAQDHGLVLHAEPPPALPTLWADGRLIIQMVVNLLSNAIKFTPRGGLVSVSARLVPGPAGAAAGGLALEVADTGIGIAPEDLPKVLAPFEQVDNHLTRTQAGTGLGLPLVKSLIELHGGDFAIVSQPNAGTTITLTFPASRLRGYPEIA